MSGTRSKEFTFHGLGCQVWGGLGGFGFEVVRIWEVGVSVGGSVGMFL